MNILIADDTENSRVLLQDLLESEGYNVMSAKNGKDALDLASKHKPDIIISDILMPLMDGFELCRNLKRDNLLKSIPVVFYTATYSTKQDKEFALSLGASRFIIKPMEPDLFLKEIKEVIKEVQQHNVDIPTEFQESEEELTERYSIVLRHKLEQKVETLQNEIVEHKRARQELCISQEQLRLAMREIEQTKFFLNSVIECMPSMLIVLDKDNRIIQWNNAAEKYFGIDRNKALNKNLFILIPGLSLLKNEIELVMKTNSYRILHNKLFSNIKDTFFNVSLFPLVVKPAFVKPDEVRYIVIRFDDITEFKKVEEQLEHSRKMELIGQLAGGIAHDFNNQLCGLLSLTEFIKYNFSRNAELISYVDKIITGINRSSDLIRKLLAFSRKGKYICKPFDLHIVIEEVISLLKHSIDKKIHIHKDYQATYSIVDGDASQVQNALLNLAINARDAMPRGGDLSFSTENLTVTNMNNDNYPELKEGTYIILMVNDTGTGMDAKTVTHIFEPFFTTKESQGGSGMGLAAVHGTIENHKGSIKVSSEPGKGTSFALYFPASNKTVSDKGKHPSPVIGSGNILLVEDELIIRESVQKILQTLGYSVISCKNGEAALKEYNNHWKELDLVILDIIMPGLNGFDVYKQMKYIQSKVKIIFISGYSKTPEIQALLSQDNVYFMKKPVDMASLTKKIAEVLGNKQEQ